uniref:Uncharacterized protein n=1 Tax=Sparus aurata TaxID=8175 RepID=A0A671VDJ0_SPAAU
MAFTPLLNKIFDLISPKTSVLHSILKNSLSKADFDFLRYFRVKPQALEVTCLFK